MLHQNNPMTQITLHDNGTKIFDRMPNTATSLQIMKTVLDIEARIAGDECLMAGAIKKAIRDNIPYRRIIMELQQSIQDNRRMVEGVIGEGLVNRVIKIQL